MECVNDSSTVKATKVSGWQRGRERERGRQKCSQKETIDAVESKRMGKTKRMTMDRNGRTAVTRTTLFVSLMHSAKLWQNLSAIE